MLGAKEGRRRLVLEALQPLSGAFGITRFVFFFHHCWTQCKGKVLLLPFLSFWIEQRPCGALWGAGTQECRRHSLIVQDQVS